jgi:hypothetical protein
MVMITKKYYKQLAEMIARSQTLNEFEDKLICYLKEDNYRFDKERFLDYIQEIKESVKK